MAHNLLRYYHGKMHIWIYTIWVLADWLLEKRWLAAGLEKRWLAAGKEEIIRRGKDSVDPKNRGELCESLLRSLLGLFCGL